MRSAVVAVACCVVFLAASAAAFSLVRTFTVVDDIQTLVIHPNRTVGWVIIDSANWYRFTIRSGSINFMETYIDSSGWGSSGDQIVGGFYQTYTNRVWVCDGPDGNFYSFSPDQVSSSPSPTLEIDTSLVFVSSFFDTAQVAGSSTGRVWAATSTAIRFFNYGGSSWSLSSTFFALPSNAKALRSSGDIDVIGRKLYFGGESGKVIIVDLDDTANLPSGGTSKTKVLTACAGTANAIRMFNQDASVLRYTHAWIGSSVSMLTKWNMITERIEGIFLYENPSGGADRIVTMAYDQARQVLFVASRTSSTERNLFRVEEIAGEIVVVDNINYLPGTDEEWFRDSILIDPESAQITAMMSPRHIATFNITDCSRRSCLNCITTDAKYCGFCAVDAACSIARVCPGERLQNADLCPRTIGITPNAGAIDGGTEVAVRGTSYVVNRIDDYQCRFNHTTASAPVSLNSTHIVCRSPSRPSAGVGSVAVLYKGQVWNDPVDYRYYSCQSNCDSCFQEAECGWCLRTANCTSRRQCAAVDFDSMMCPAITNVAPRSAETINSSPVTVTVSRVIAGATYLCRFGSLPVVAATSSTPGNPGTVTCPSPITSNPANVDLAILLQDIPSPYTPTNATFELYNCAPVNPCFSCVDTLRPTCVFCASTLTCTRSDNTSVCAGGPANRECPLLTGTEPRSASVADLTGRNLTLIGNLPAVANMFCDWGASGRTPASSLNATHITCPFPASPAPGDIFVSVYSGSIAYSNPLPFRFYNCDLLTSCSSCIDPLHTSCVYCTDGASLRCSRAAAAGTNCPSSPVLTPSLNVCPSIVDVSPNNGALDGAMPINITLSTAPTNPGTIQCRFAGSVTTPGTQSGNVISCSTPSPVPALGNVSVEVLLSSKLYAPAKFMRIYDCGVSNAGASISTCDACLLPDRPSCTWCAGSSCSSTRACASGTITQCPSISSVVPSSGSAEGGEAVFVAATSLPADVSDIKLECSFGTATVPAIIADSKDGVICTTPASVIVGSVNLRLLINNRPFAPQTLSFRYFRCNSGLPSCLPACFSDPDCGWCISNQLCISKTQCARSNPSRSIATPPVWLNGTCLSASIVPNHVQVGESYNNDSKITFVVPALSAAISLSTAKKRSLPTDVSLFQCAFDLTGNLTTPVTALTADSATCLVPFSNSTQASIARLLYDGSDLTVPQSFAFVDCRVEARCGRCILSPTCGWCLQSALCTTELSCNSSANTFSKQDCPSFRSVTPQLGVNSGGTTVTVTGSLFLNSTKWQVLVDNSTRVPATWVSETALTFITPAIAGKVGTVNVSILLDGVLYTDEPVGFTFQEPPAELTGGNVGLAAGLGAGLGLLALIAAIVIAIIIVRRRRDNSIRLKEPDYAVVAYGDFLQAKFKMPKDNLDILAIKLLDKSHGLLLAIEGGTSPTEADLVAKALTFLYSSYPGKAEEAIQALVAGEISRTKQETTLFRQNSMASKMFKFYSKVVGIRYLFKTLARFIAEINHLAAEASAGRGAKAGESLLTVDIEIDNDKMKPSEADQELMREANVMQLNLTCQKVFNACRTNLNSMPVEFKRIFRQMQYQLLAKWSDMEIVYKAVGGFLYLRFLCPAITAPHAYGLLENPPNETAQRQLVLIGKVIQNLANLQPPGAKEAYMAALDNFYDKNLDRMRDFYKELLREDVIEGETDDAPPVTEAVKANSLGTIWNHVLAYKGKIEAASKELADDDAKNSATAAVPELIETYGEKKLGKVKAEPK